jgi:hypothetical protein
MRISPFLQALPMLWWGIYLMIFALRMPVDYQYGRYLMPTIPYLLLYGVLGTSRWLFPRSKRLAARVASRAAPLAIACLFVAFLLLGRQAYADDVCIINGEMVDVARWLDAETSPDAVVAAHDIGAIGYWSERQLLDLAGLITPEVIPFIRDETLLLEFILENGAEYVVTFPSWYPHMTADRRLRPIYETNYTLTLEKGNDNMVVYEVLRQ